MKKLFASLALVLLPSLALAATFAPQSIFLSQSPVVEGDTVRIYAIVSNPTADKFSGMVTLSESAATIGSVAVTLAAGATQTASVLWKPTQGSHTITATLKADSGTVAETKQATFAVEAPPKPAAASASSQSATAVESSQAIQQQIGNVSPQVEGAVAPAFTFIDGVRQSIASAADQQIGQTQPKIAPIPLPGSVEGAQTEAPSGTGWVWAIVYTIYFYVLTLVRFVVGSAGVFYPVLAVVFLYVMWKMFRKFRRPAY